MTEPNHSRITICENCGGSDFDLVFSGSDKLLGMTGQYQIIKCQHCGIYLTSPRISNEEMQKYYPEEYICYLEAIEDDPIFFSRLDRKIALKKRCKQILKRFEEFGKILDVGCATGIFLNGMQNLDWEVAGIEPNEKAAAYARKRFDIDVFTGYLNEAHYPDDTFDVITIWDVLEHVPEPEDFINEIYRVLKPGGLVIATLPNANSWERYLFGEHWVGWEIPRHYRSHTPDTITEFLNKHSFQNIEIFSFIGRHGAFMLSIDFWLNSSHKNTKKKKAIRTLLASLPFRLLSYPFFRIAEFFNRSNVMSFSAQKLNKSIK